MKEAWGAPETWPAPPEAQRGRRVLVVDDDPGVREALGRALGHAGYVVTTAGDGVRALDALARAPVDIVLLDLMMPFMDGLEVCRRLRAQGHATPILVLTARDAVEDRVDGLDAGADDYLVKPFALKELLARVRALLRRALGEGYETLGYADLSLDTATHQVLRAGQAVELTRTEFLLLELLLRNAELVLTYEVMVDRVWGYGSGPNSNSLQVLIGYLRRKLEAGEQSRLVHTVRGVGYVLRAER